MSRAEMITREYSATTADYYDQGNAASSEDVEFWTSVADSIEGPILEIGCGTGRVGLEIARRGKEVTGVDQAEAILDVFRRKLAAEAEPVRSRVRLYRGDMRSFDLGKKFSLVLIPFRPLQHMLTLEDQLAALAAARRHLAPGGMLGFDVFFPNFRSIIGPCGEEQLDEEWTGSDGRLVRRFYVRHSADKINQVLRGSYIFRTYRDKELVREETSPLNMSYYTYPQLRLLLMLNSFEPVEEYGSFQREPLRVEKEMIILARAV